MTLQINGDKVDVPANVSTVKELVDHLQLGDKKFVIEVNRDILVKDQHETTELQDGDAVEIVHFVGGG